MHLRCVLAISLVITVTACGSSPGVDAGDTSDTATGDTIATTNDTQDSYEVSDESPGSCGDGVVAGSEECEPSGPVACELDCTLSPGATGSIAWVFVDSVPTDAHAIAVDDAGRVTVVGTRDLATSDAWVGRLEPDGTLGWRIEHDGGYGDIARDVELDEQGRAIVVGDEGTAMYPNAWIAAYNDDGSEAWSVTSPSQQMFGNSANAVAVLANEIYVAIDSPAGGIESEPSLTTFDGAGMPGATRLWTIGYDSAATSLSADPVAMQLIQVGSWNEGNWIEAVDLDAQTLWTANEAIDPAPGEGLATVQDVAIDADGFIHVVGEENYSDGQNGWTTTYVRRLTSDGQPDWTVLPVTGAGLHAVAVVDDVVYVVGSQGGVGMWLAAHSTDAGELIWQHQIPLDPDGPDIIYDIQAGPDSLWVAGMKWDGGEQRAYVARIDR